MSPPNTPTKLNKYSRLPPKKSAMTKALQNGLHVE